MDIVEKLEMYKHSGSESEGEEFAQEAIDEIKNLRENLNALTNWLRTFSLEAKNILKVNQN